MRDIAPRTLFVTAILFYCFFSVCAGCTPTAEKIDHGLVLATVRPYALIATEIAAPRLRVETLLPPQSSPYTWSPRPEELERAAKAGLIIANGLGLEARLGSFLDRFVARTLYVASLLGFEEDFRRDNNLTYDIALSARPPVAARDPHFWTDPLLMIHFADVLAEHFSALDPEGAAVYAANYERFANRIAALDRRIREQAGMYRRRSLITFHDAFMRFFDRYGIERIASAMPAAERFTELGGLIRVHRIPALYSEPRLDPGSVHILAAEYDLPVYMLDSLGTHESVTDYASFLLFNWEQFQKGFVR